MQIDDNRLYGLDVPGHTRLATEVDALDLVKRLCDPEVAAKVVASVIKFIYAPPSPSGSNAVAINQRQLAAFLMNRAISACGAVGTEAERLFRDSNLFEGSCFDFKVFEHLGPAYVAVS